jgi:flagellar biosynthesis protein FlhB
MCQQRFVGLEFTTTKITHLNFFFPIFQISRSVEILRKIFKKGVLSYLCYIQIRLKLSRLAWTTMFINISILLLWLLKDPCLIIGYMYPHVLKEGIGNFFWSIKTDAWKTVFLKH